MTEDTLPAGEMKYSFKAHMQAHGFAGDLITLNQGLLNTYDYVDWLSIHSGEA